MKFYNPFKLHIVTDGKYFYVRKFLISHPEFRLYVNKELQKRYNQEKWVSHSESFVFEFPPLQEQVKLHSKEMANDLINQINNFRPPKKEKNVPEWNIIDR